MIPLLDAVGYPWSLASIYPSVTAEYGYYDHLSVELPTQYPTVQPCKSSHSMLECQVSFESV